MRRSFALVSISAVLLAGCAGSSDPAPLFDGFVPQAAGAVIFEPVVCDVPFMGTASVSGVAVYLSSDADPCAIVAATELCGTKASSTAVLALVLRGQAGADGIAAAGAGTYRYLRDPPTGSGEFLAATGDAARVDASCASDASGAPDVTGGQIVLASVGDSVTGSAHLSFEGNQLFDQNFDATVCPVSVDLCQRLSIGCLGGWTCVP